MRTRATQRRTPETSETQVSVQDYFFRRLPDSSLELRKDVVTRAELFGALEWYHNKSIELNRWYRVLWRLMRRKPGYLNPFRIVRVMRKIQPVEKQLVTSTAGIER